MDIKIYESSKKVSDIGAGILFSGRALQIMREAGLGDQIAAILPEDVDHLSEGLFDFYRFFFQKINLLATDFVIRKGDQPEGFTVHERKTKGMHT